MGTPLNGRRAQAARNDQLILDAARAVFVDDPGAPIAAVAERAGVGISALYRRHGSKEDLLRRLVGDAVAAYAAAAEAALADDGDPGAAFAAFLRGAVAADSHLVRSLAGTFTPTPELYRSFTRAEELGTALLERAQAAGAVRGDLVPADLGVLLQQIAGVRMPDDEARTRELRARYLALLLDALLLDSPLRPGAEPLPGPAPRREEFARRWQGASGSGR